MVKRLLLLVSIFVFCGTYAQKPEKKQEKKFPVKIDGTIRNFTGKTIYVHHKTPESTISDSAKVANGKFMFNLKASEPTMYWFTTTPDAGSKLTYVFFADEGTSKVNLIGDSLYYSAVEAGPTQQDYLQYRMVINNLVMQQQRMQSDYNAAQQAGDMNRMTAIQQEFQGLNTQYVNDMKNFMKAHPKSHMSAFILGNDLNNENIAAEQVIEALGYLDNSLASNSFVAATNKKVNAIRGTMVGYPANNFSQNTPDGKPVKLSDYKGQYVLIDFWASWCRPCRMENPNVVSAYQRYKNKGFTVLGVSMDSNKDLWTQAIKADNLTWQHVSDLKGWGNEVGILYGVKGIPQNFLVDKEGKIVAKNLRGPELDEKLAEIIK